MLDSFMFLKNNTGILDFFVWSFMHFSCFGCTALCLKGFYFFLCITDQKPLHECNSYLRVLYKTSTITMGILFLDDLEISCRFSVGSRVFEHLR